MSDTEHRTSGPWTRDSTRDTILNRMADEAVPAALVAIAATTGITPATEDAEALADWLRNRFLDRVKDSVTRVYEAARDNVACTNTSTLLRALTASLDAADEAFEAGGTDHAYQHVTHARRLVHAALTAATETNTHV
jgi:hypothetical protein